MPDSLLALRASLGNPGDTLGGQRASKQQDRHVRRLELSLYWETRSWWTFLNIDLGAADLSLCPNIPGRRFDLQRATTLLQSAVGGLGEVMGSSYQGYKQTYLTGKAGRWFSMNCLKHL